MRGFGFLFWLGLLDEGDLQQFIGEFFRLKDGELTRKQFYAGQIVVLGILLLIVMLGVFIFFLKNPAFSHMSSETTRNVAIGIVWVTATPVQISAFLRRMNDASMTKWLGLIFVLPIIGNVIATALGAIFPSNYGITRDY